MVLQKEGNLDIATHTRQTATWNEGRDWSGAGANHGMTKTVSNHHKLGRSKERSFLRVFKESKALLTPWIWTSILQNCETTCLLFQSTQLMVISYSSLKKLLCMITNLLGYTYKFSGAKFLKAHHVRIFGNGA